MMTDEEVRGRILDAYDRHRERGPVARQDLMPPGVDDATFDRLIDDLSDRGYVIRRRGDDYVSDFDEDFDEAYRALSSSIRPPTAPTAFQPAVDELLAREIRYARAREEAREIVRRERESTRDAPLRVTSGAELLEQPDTLWLVDGLLPLVGTFQIYGESGVGKSFVVQDLLLSVATGERWLDHFPVLETGNVVYVAAEGGADLGKRLRGWLAARGIPDAPERYLCVIEQGVDLRSRRDVDEVIALCRDHEIRLVVFDTWAEHMPGGDENSGRDAGLAIASLKRIASATECLVGTVHHVGHTDKNRARGWSGGRASWDAEFEFRGHALVHTKSRYGPKHEPIGVEMVPSEGTLVLRRVEPYAAVAHAEIDLQRKVVETVRLKPGATWTTLRNLIGGNSRRAGAARDDLVDTGVLRVDRGRYYPGEGYE